MSRVGVDAAKRNRACRPRAGWSLIEVVVTTAIVGTLGVAIVTSMTHEVASSQRNQCKANLEMIEAAKNSWVADHPGQKIVPPAGPNDQDPLAQYIRGGVVPKTCPVDGEAYTNLPNSNSNSTAGMYDPAQPCYCPYHQQQAYPTPTP